MNISSLGTRWHSLSPYLLSVLRIVTAFLSMLFGTAKWFAFPASIMPDGSTASLMSLAGAAAVLETVGGLLLLIGLFSRPIAFLVSGEMAFAYFIGHAPQGFWPVLNQGTPAILFSFIWLYSRKNACAVCTCARPSAGDPQPCTFENLPGSCRLYRAK